MLLFQASVSCGAVSVFLPVVEVFDEGGVALGVELLSDGVCCADHELLALAEEG